MAKLSFLQTITLQRAANGREGTYLTAEQQAGRIRQVNWLLNRKYVHKPDNHRIVTTKLGKEILLRNIR